jgi:predicted NUDIX family NTP pyrophosphohydrolase
MIKNSAGVLVYKKAGEQLMVFLVHPGGPFWAKKDYGAWSIPKGQFSDDEDGLTAARREFHEEVGQVIDGNFRELTPCRQPSRKIIHTWAVEGDADERRIESNEFEMEWPPKSGKMQRFPEVDKGAWFRVTEAKDRIQPGQIPILEELCRLLGVPIGTKEPG